MMLDGWGFEMLWMALFWVGLILVIVWAVRQFSEDRPPGADGSRGRAVEILEERYARGEIDRDEFEERRRTLRGR